MLKIKIKLESDIYFFLLTIFLFCEKHYCVRTFLIFDHTVE